jgi:UDP-N-acetylmuramoyl-tripeptide--D-alanyl-D-alanine ligase
MRTLFKKIVVKILLLEARAVLRKYKPNIVAVTGSVGKTSAKDAIFSVLAGSYHVRKSQKSYNSEIGLPLTILGVQNAWNNPLRWLQNFIDGILLLVGPATYPEWLVLEIGADRPGDIKNLAKWLQVDVAVITRLPAVPVHVEYFDSPEEVIEEKASLINALKPQGTLVLYAGDKEAEMLKPRAGTHPVLTFGLVAHANVRIDEPKLLYEKSKESWPIGMSAEMIVGDTSAPIEVVGAIGAHALLPALAGAAVGKALNIPLEQIVKALAGYEPPLGRMHVLHGIKDTLIIDDTYNSSPAAVVAALDALNVVGTHAMSRKIAVLSDMLELGKHSGAEHKKVGAHAAKTCDLLLTVGLRARDIAQGALDAGMADAAILQFESAEQAGTELQSMMHERDVILVKGSQSMRMEKVVEEVMAEPERAAELLVRQDAEWKKR